MSFPIKRIREIGKYLAEFALEFFQGNADPGSYEADQLLVFFDTWFDNFIRYAETNSLITRDEVQMLTENPNGLDDYIKEAAVEAAREIFMKKAS
jgi:hypothetical protein